MTTDLLTYVRTNPGRLVIPTRIAERVLAYIAGHPGEHAAAVGRAVGCSGTEIRRHVGELDACGYITRGPRGPHIPLAATPLGHAYLEVAGSAA